MSGVVRLDNLQAVYGGGHIYSVQSDVAVQNGQVGVVGDLLADEREVRALNAPADVAKDQAVLVAQDEIIYDQTRKSQGNLKNFQIEAGTAFRAYDLKENDLFSVSTDVVDALATDVVVGNKVVLQVGSLNLAEIAPASITTERFVGKIEAIETVGVQTVVGAPGYVDTTVKYVVVKVEKN